MANHSIDDVSLSGLGEGRKSALKALGICNLSQLIAWTPEELLCALIHKNAAYRSWFGKDLPAIIGRAKAMCWGRPVLWHRLDEDSLRRCAILKDDIYFDLEYDSQEPPYIFAWTAGVAVEDPDSDGEFQVLNSDFAKEKQDAPRVLESFKAFVLRHPQSRFIGYSLPSAEFSILNRLYPALKRYLVTRSYDPYAILNNHLALPVPETKLKPVCHWVTGLPVQEMDALGEYERYRRITDASEKKIIMNQILMYNAQDVRLTWAIARAIARFVHDLEEE